MWLIALLACGTDQSTDFAPVTPPVIVPAKPADVAAVEATKSPADSDILETSAGKVTFTPLVHATLRVDVSGKTIWVDPWSKADLTGPKADLILLTDIHPDHLDKTAIDAVNKDGTIIIAPAAVQTEVPTAQKLANGESTDAIGIKVEAVPMYNLERGPEPGKLFHDKGRGNGYVLTIGDKRVYIAGDTECTPEVKAMTAIDVAFVPMNLPYTMTPEEAADCVVAFHPAVVYPFHYGDSDLTAFVTKVQPAGIVVRQRNWYPNGSPF